ncbi:MAG: VOC family protein [Planctomycetota bacterium]
MKILLSPPVLTVSNLDTSLKYFLDKMGFELAFPGDTYAGVKRDKAEIHLAVKTSQEQHGHILNEAGKSNLYLICDDAQEYFHQIKGNGGFYLSEPKLRDGIKSFAVKDPDGNIILVGEDCG